MSGTPFHILPSAGPERECRNAARANLQGFTLLELLIVIAIIAILIGILIPGLRLASAQTGAASCQARIRQWGFAFQMYLADNGGIWFPRVSRIPWLEIAAPYFLSSIKGTRPYTQVVVPGQDPTSTVKGITMCPLTRHNKPAPFATTPVEMDLLLPKTWKHVDVSYGLNYSVYSARHDYRFGNIDEDPLAWRTSDVRGASNIPVFGDCHGEIRPYHISHQLGPPAKQAQLSNLWASWCIDRHRGGINMLFMDWSVRKVGLKELWTLKWHRRFDTAGPWTTAGGVRPEDWPEWMRKYKDY